MTSTKVTVGAVANRKALESAIAAALLTCEKRNTVPILSNVLLRGTPDGLLTLRTTNLEQENTVTVIDAKADPAFATTIPAHDLSTLLRKAPASESVIFEAVDTHQHLPESVATIDGAKEVLAPERIVVTPANKLTARWGRLRYDLNTITTANFPCEMASDEKMPWQFDIPTPAFAAMIDAVKMCISTEETRYYLNGIFMHVPMNIGTSDVLRFVATDGHKLARHDIPAPVMLQQKRSLVEACQAAQEATSERIPPGVIIPLYAVNVLRKLVNGGKRAATVGVEMNATRAVFTVGDVRMATKFIDGTFPDYARVIPAGKSHIVTLHRGGMIECVKAVGAIRNDKGNRVVKLTLDNGTLVVSQKNPDKGDASATMECAMSPFDGKPMEVGLNADYATSILEAIESEGVTLRLDTPGNPVLIHATGDDKTTIYVLMPARF